MLQPKFQFLPSHLWPTNNLPEVEPKEGSLFIPDKVRPLRKFAQSQLGIKRPYLHNKDKLTQMCLEALNNQ